MRFRDPIDDVQWNSAAKFHTDMRAYLRKLRADYAPLTEAHRDSLKDLRDLLQDFGRELLQPHDRIAAAELNRLRAAITEASIEYVVARRASSL